MRDTAPQKAGERAAGAALAPPPQHLPRALAPKCLTSLAAATEKSGEELCEPNTASAIGPWVPPHANNQLEACAAARRTAHRRTHASTRA